MDRRTRSGLIRWERWVLALVALSSVGLAFLLGGWGAPTMPNLLDTRSILIEDDLQAMSMAENYKRHYTLQRDGDQFTGTASFTVGVDNISENIRAVSSTVELAIPAHVISVFLEMLAQTPFEEGIYAPPTPTDYHKYRSIKLLTSDSRIIFYSDATDHSRWALYINEEMDYVTTSYLIPHEALLLLAPHLKHEIFQDLRRRYLQQFETADEPRAAPTITPTMGR